MMGFLDSIMGGSNPFLQQASNQIGNLVNQAGQQVSTMEPPKPAKQDPVAANIMMPVTEGLGVGAIGQSSNALAGFNPLMQAGSNLGVYGQQQQLAQMLMQQAQGQGPNPAQNMLNQATGSNVNQQAALMGSQRGVNANPALLAKQSAMQGNQIQQQAAGQAATMGANQQLAAQQALSGQQAQMAGQNLGMQNAYTQAAQAQLGTLLGGINAQNQAQIGMQSNLNSINSQNFATTHNAANNVNIAQLNNQAATDRQQTATNNQLLGGLLNAGGAALGIPKLFNDGGKVPGQPKVNENNVKNDTVPAMLSPGELVIPLESMKSKAHAMKFVQDHFSKKGK